eukprot:scaffold1040_cov40-Cyclotella_meneghiniana.AAC.3
MTLDIIKITDRKPNIKPTVSCRRNLRSQNKSIADRVKHRRLLAKQSTVSKETDSIITKAYGKRVRSTKRKSATA